MMEEYEVRITDAALDDMERIYDYIACRLAAPESAIGQYNRIADAVLTLSTLPERFTLFETEPERSWGMRRMVVDNYVVCYVIRPGTVTVTDVLYGASDLHTRLSERNGENP